MQYTTASLPDNIKSMAESFTNYVSVKSTVKNQENNKPKNTQKI